MASYIKLHRKLLNWEWFNKPEILSVFIYCLIRANYEDGEFQGHKILRGQFITSPEKIAQATGLTYQNVRTVLNKLILTNEINKQSTNKYTVITICNYDSYQGLDIETNKQTPNKQRPKQQTTNKPLTTSKKLEEIEEEKEVYTFDQFWNDYDKKVGDKEVLEKKWMQIKDIDKEIIKAYIPKYKLSQPDKKFRKDPSTFINQKAWNNEIIGLFDGIKNEPIERMCIFKSKYSGQGMEIKDTYSRYEREVKQCGQENVTFIRYAD